MEFDFANPMNLYAFACLRLTRKSYEFVFVCASLPIQSTSDDVPRTVAVLFLKPSAALSAVLSGSVVFPSG